jgi:hypothetical protein
MEHEINLDSEQRRLRVTAYLMRYNGIADEQLHLLHSRYKREEYLHLLFEILRLLVVGIIDDSSH